MAETTSTTKGVILFTIFAVLIGGGLAATPVYLRSLQSPNQQLNHDVLEDVETVRYAVININPHVFALRDMRRPGGEQEPKPDGELLARQDIIAKELMQSLSQTANVLRGVAEIDVKQRGIKDSVNVKVAQGAVNITAAYNEVDTKLYAAQEKSLKDADTALNRLRSVSRGGQSGVNHLWVTRIQAVLTDARAALFEHRGDFESSLAAMYLHEADSLSRPLAAMRQSAAAILTGKPIEAAQHVSRLLEENTAAQEEFSKQIEKLSALIASITSRIAELDRTAAQARVQMAQWAASVGTESTTMSAYLKLSDQARQAERESAVLNFGTLAGAELTVDLGATPDLVYQGGQPQPGLRDLSARLDELKEQAALLDDAHKSLIEDQDSLSKVMESLDTQKAEVDQHIEQLSSTLDTLMAQAGKHFEAAHKAREEAVKTYLAAAKAAKSAVTEAQKITREAKAAAPPDSAVENAMRRLGSDVDLEASMQYLMADASARAACVNATRLLDVDIESTGLLSIATRIGRETPSPAQVDVDALRTQAAAYVADALKSYEQAANLIGRSSVKFTDGSVTGKNYLWPVQIAQASLHILIASLHAEKPEEAQVALDKAYALLSEATKGREQSPLLAPALDTLVYLQQSAR